MHVDDADESGADDARAERRQRPGLRRRARRVRYSGCRARRAPSPPPATRRDAAAWRERLVELTARSSRARRNARDPPRRDDDGDRRRRPEQGDRRRGHARLALPDRIDHEGVDGDARHAARRRGTARPRRARRRRAARLPGRRPGRDPHGDDRGTCSRTRAGSTATSSPTPAAATTASRATSTASPRSRRTIRSGRPGRTATPASSLAGRIVEQLTGTDVGRRAPGASGPRRFGSDPHRDAARGCAAPQDGRRPRRRAGRGPRRRRPPWAPDPLDGAGGPDHGERRGRARVRADAPGRRCRCGRHPRAVGRVVRGDGGEGGRASRHAHARRLVGARLDPLRLGRRAAPRPRREHDRAVGVPAAAALSRASPSRCSRTAATRWISSTTSTARSSARPRGSRCRARSSHPARRLRSSPTGTSGATSARR